MVGTVDSFDRHRGWGWIRSDGDRWFFHCTAIADGTRDIDVGVPVEFEVVAGGPGRWEAAGVSRVIGGR